MARILLVGIDDVSLSEINATLTPRIHAFRQTAFEPRAFSHPVCSQSRQGILFGCYGKKIGTWRDIGSTTPQPWTPPASLVTLPQVLQQAGYATALVGKWHCGPAPSGAHWAFGPLERGWNEWIAGTRLNIAPGDYDDWQRADATSLGFVIDDHETQHATLAQLEAALAWIDVHPKGPVLLHVALNLPHSPFHVPPSSLLAGWEVPAFPNNRELYKAMLRAADTAFGSLLDAFGNGTVILFSDNGTPGGVVAGGVNPAHAKETTFDPGIQVVMFGRWPGCPAGPSNDLNHLVDIPAGVCAIAGVSAPATWDSQIGGRPHILSEAEQGDGDRDRAARTATYKLRQVTPSGGTTLEELYDLVGDPLETTPLSLSEPAHQSALSYLRDQLDAAAL